MIVIPSLFYRLQGMDRDRAEEGQGKKSGLEAAATDPSLGRGNRRRRRRRFFDEEKVDQTEGGDGSLSPNSRVTSPSAGPRLASPVLTRAASSAGTVSASAGTESPTVAPASSAADRSSPTGMERPPSSLVNNRVSPPLLDEEMSLPGSTASSCQVRTKNQLR